MDKARPFLKACAACKADMAAALLQRILQGAFRLIHQKLGRGSISWIDAGYT